MRGRLQKLPVGAVQRFFIEPPLAGGTIELPRHVARQATTVLRMRPGDPLVLFDGTGGEWRAEVASTALGQATAHLLRHWAPNVEPPLRVILCTALLKADKFEWVLQKGTELGVAAFLPLITARVVSATHTRVHSADSGEIAEPGQRHQTGQAFTPGEKTKARESSQRESPKMERWRRIVIEAAEQSGRTSIPKVYDPVRLSEALGRPGPKVLCWEDERKQAFQVAMEAALTGQQSDVYVIIGPEGGFTPEEVQTAVHAGARIASLGPRTLRSETAALAAAAIALLARPRVANERSSEAAKH